MEIIGLPKVQPKVLYMIPFTATADGGWEFNPKVDESPGHSIYSVLHVDWEIGFM